jgi:hypothetical protein
MPRCPDTIIIINYGRLMAAGAQLREAAYTAWKAIEELDTPAGDRPAPYPWSVLGPMCDEADRLAAQVEGISAHILKVVKDLAQAKLAEDLSYRTNAAKP